MSSYDADQLIDKIRELEEELAEVPEEVYVGTGVDFTGNDPADEYAGALKVTHREGYENHALIEHNGGCCNQYMVLDPQQALRMAGALYHIATKNMGDE